MGAYAVGLVVSCLFILAWNFIGNVSKERGDYGWMTAAFLFWIVSYIVWAWCLITILNRWWY